jgi:hypothetical protein
MVTQYVKKQERERERERELQGLGGNDVTCYLIILKGRVRGKREAKSKLIFIFLTFHF